MEPMRAKCAKCGDIVEVSHFKEYKSCKCGAISLDYGDGYYCRMGGAPDDFDKEFDKEQGIDRFKPFKELEKLSSNTETLVLKKQEVKPVEDMSYEELSSVTTIYGEEIMQMCTLTKKVWEWFDEKGLKDPMVQFVKMEEECGELAHELTRGKTFSREVVDALGDILVTVIGLCHHLHIPPQAALTLAYNEIKDRKGKVINNSFVKEEK